MPLSFAVCFTRGISEGTGGHRCCSLKILTANKYLIDGSARRRPSRPLRWTHPNCWALQHVNEGGQKSHPSHRLVSMKQLRILGTSTKGPGVYPGHPFVRQVALDRCQHLNEGTGSLSRSSCHDERRFGDTFPATSTKGPGVYPGHAKVPVMSEVATTLPQRRDREFIPVIDVMAANAVARVTSTKGPGVYPGHPQSVTVSCASSSSPQRRDREFIPVIDHKGDSHTRHHNLNEGTGSLSRSSCRMPFHGSRSRYLNEGTGSLSRSFVGRANLEACGTTSTKGPGVYPGHRLLNRVSVRIANTSTKGPGVYPGHCVFSCICRLRDRTSTKGPGVYPGHYAVLTTSDFFQVPQRRDREFIPVISSRGTVWLARTYLNEGTGSLSRSFDRRFAYVVHVLTSTKGPGVYPGHVRAVRSEGRGYLTSTKGPGVYPGHSPIFYQHLSSSQGSACERSERKGVIKRRTTRKRTRYPSHQAKEGASNTDETQNERPLALASNNDSPIGRNIEMRPQAHDAPRCPRIGNTHIAHQNRVFLT